MQGNGIPDFKMCLCCGLLNRIPDSEIGPEFIQCDNCGQNIRINKVLGIIHRLRGIKLNRRDFNQAIFSLILLLISPFWSNQYNKIGNDKKEIKPEFPSISIHPEPASAVATASIGAVIIGNRNEASFHT